MSRHQDRSSEDNHCYLEKQWVVVEDFDAPGLILDIGGGGEGIIGILKGDKVVAIDFRKEELEEAAAGPLKIVMDARHLQFLDQTFDTATAFFSLMYIKSYADHERVFQEVFRVLKPGGRFHIWDVSIRRPPDEEKEIYIVPVTVSLGDKQVDTGYGQPWPAEPHDLPFYAGLAVRSGFIVVEQTETGQVFFLQLKKP